MSRNSIPVYTDAAYVMEVGPTNSMGELRLFSMRQACSASCYVFFLLAKIRTNVGKPSLNEAFIYTRNQSQFFALLNLIVTRQYKYYEVINY